MPLWPLRQCPNFTSTCLGVNVCLALCLKSVFNVKALETLSTRRFLRDCEKHCTALLSIFMKWGCITRLCSTNGITSPFVHLITNVGYYVQHQGSHSTALSLVPASRDEDMRSSRCWQQCDTLHPLYTKHTRAVNECLQRTEEGPLLALLAFKNISDQTACWLWSLRSSIPISTRRRP